MYINPIRFRLQSGIVMLEGLIAILIFSLGILAIVGTQAVAVKQVSDAQYRSEAGLLANRLVGEMWSSDRDTAALQTKFNTGGAGYNAWLEDVTAALPGVAANPPTVVVGSDEITITVYWLAPSEVSSATAHKYVLITQVTQ